MYGQTCTQVMQEMHLSGSTQAVWPPTGICFCERIDAARAGDRVGLGDRLGDELRRVGRAAEEQPLAGEIDRPQLHVGFEEEPVGVERHAEQLGELLRGRRAAPWARPGRPGPARPPGRAPAPARAPAGAGRPSRLSSGGRSGS